MYYTNPILAGDYPDPSILQVGSVYYMTHSSFSYHPGLLIWRSEDLVNWMPVTYALKKYVGSVWAPEFICHEGKYYIYFPAGRTNWVITASSPEGPWSEPIDLKISYIDPGHIADQEGRRWIFLSGGKAVPLSSDGLTITGPLRDTYKGWPIPEDWIVGNYALEAPKLFFHRGFYYLTVAEGGTAGPATAHMAVVMRASDLSGSWEFSPYNPVVHTWSREELWHAKGHGTVFEDASGHWWVIYHGYERDYVNLGRQTLLEPLEWTDDGWFRIPSGVKTDNPIFAGYSARGQAKNRNISNDSLRDGRKLMWQFAAETGTNHGEWSDKGLSLKDSLITCIPVDHSFETEVTAVLEDDEAEAQFLIYYNEEACCGIGFNRRSCFSRRRQSVMDNIEGSFREARLKLVNDRNEAVFYRDCHDGRGYIKSVIGVDISGFNHNNFGGFLGIRIALAGLKGRVCFRDFEYRPGCS
jgi:beta-xylosidase